MLGPWESNRQKQSVGTDDFVNIPNRIKWLLIEPEAIYNDGISLDILEYRSVNECTRSATFADWQGDAGFPRPRERAATFPAFRTWHNLRLENHRIHSTILEKQEYVTCAADDHRRDVWEILHTRCDVTSGGEMGPWLGIVASSQQRPLVMEFFVSSDDSMTA